MGNVYLLKANRSRRLALMNASVSHTRSSIVVVGLRRAGHLGHADLQPIVKRLLPGKSHAIKQSISGSGLF